MKTEYFLKLCVVATVLLAACDDTRYSLHISGGGISGTGISIGPIADFDLVLVNGIAFETSSALITVNGQPATQDALKIGMIVQVEGTQQTDGKTGMAEHIRFNENVKGPVQSIDNNSLQVLGQTVYVEQQTILDGISDLSALNTGDVISVSGLVDANAAIHATWIGREQALNTFEVVGRVAQLDQSTQTFSIGALTINYGLALEIDIPNGRLYSGLLVEVQGGFTGPLTEEILMASHITTEDELLAAEAGTAVEVEGFITRFNTPTDFEVAWLTATTTDQTVFQWGRADDLAQGVKVEIEGTLNQQGVLVLEEVIFQATTRTSAEHIKIEAEIEAIEAIRQTITLLGLPIQTTSTTQFRDKQAGTVSLSFSNLKIGDRVAIIGFLNAATSLLTAEVLLRQPLRADQQVILEGPVNHIDTQAKSFKLLDIPILTNTNTSYVKEDMNNLAVTAETFFVDLQQSTALVEVQGRWLGYAILASRLEVDK